MPETRSEALLREAVLRDAEELFNSRFESVESKIQQMTAEFKDNLASMNSEFKDNLATMFNAIKQLPGTASGTTSGEKTPVIELDTGPRLPQGPLEPPRNRQVYSGMTRLSKIDFPRFSGSKVKDWLFKVEQFFSIDHTPEDLKVSLASIHFDDQVATWHQSLMHTEIGKTVTCDWHGYKILILERFGELLDDPIAELKNLHETSGIGDYHNQFETIRNRVTMSEDYLLSAYLAGLNLDTQMHVRMFQPRTISQCFKLAKLYESAYPTKKFVPNHPAPSKPLGTTGRTFFTPRKLDPPVRHEGLIGNKPKEETLGPKKFLTTEEMNDRRAKGLCFYCDEPFTPGHHLKHKRGQLYMMEFEEQCDEADEDDTLSEEENAQVQISVNAMAGISDFRTMRVRGKHGKKTLFILIDSGSTHNFMDQKVAAALNCNMSSAGSTKVSVADGSKLAVSAKIKDFEWTLQNFTFSTDLMVIPLGCCDMVLGIQWLETLGPIRWDFKNLIMEFTLDNKKIVMKGIQQGSVKEMKAKKISKFCPQDAQLALLCVSPNVEPSQPSLCTLQVSQEPVTPNNPLDALLHKFADLFLPPTQLPPFRDGMDHKITLQQGTNPINLRPYRYAVYQKNEIDRIVQEMLKEGSIQNSCSAFASPVVLVKKKDGTWRLCVDYRNLNSSTIKDRFPIPLIEDLMDELGGSTIYSKIDLRSGYHQVRMHPSDVHKTAFKTHNGQYEYLVMPFGLTNAPATFQRLMNSVFRDFLRHSVLIFFDDILVYSSSMADHRTHLDAVFQTMRDNSLLAKRSKCSFAVDKVEYLGHYISAAGIATDPSKVKAVAEWPVPTNVKQLRGFLGLAGYYRRFVRNFGVIARPLTELTKKDAFSWTAEADDAFTSLKTALCEAPVLALPVFDKPFLVETDASSTGIGAVLMQNGHPLAYISRHLKGKQLLLSIYEKELLAVVFAVQKWRHYLLSGHFIIKNDQKSLKYLLEQRLNTPVQQQWLPKLLEFDYEIQYREGKENLAADALSRVEGAEILHMALSVFECDLLQQIQDAYTTDPNLHSIIEALKLDPAAKRHFTWSNGTMRRKGKLVVPQSIALKDKILDWLHCSSAGGHSGRDVTYQRLKSLFYWKGMTKDIQHFIRSCTTCQQCKNDNAASPGLLQPLPIPEGIWLDISLDFITGLPLSFGMSVILVVVDRFSKAAHFVALAHPYTALSVAQAYMDNIFKLHGFPKSIVSDRDAIFLSDFWRELFTLHGVSLNLSSAYHPQSDGQTEVVNRCIENYLRCMSSDRPHLWKKWLPLAEFWYNTSFHSASQLTPYEAVYGQAPPHHLPYMPGESKVHTVARTMQEREAMIRLLRFHLLRAQHRMEQVANARRSDRQFDLGDWVYVKLQPYRQQSVVLRSSQKLAPRFYGPYKVIDKIGKVAYKLQLPPSSHVHPVFHVSQLKQHVGNVTVSSSLPSVATDVLSKEPECIIARRSVNRQGRAVTQVLVKWVNQPIEEATWEFLFDIFNKYPDFDAYAAQPCGQGSSRGGDLLQESECET